MESMTGYGRAAAEGDGLRIQVELRGVNHKALDVHAVLPSVLLCHELECRKAVKAHVSRGHVDVRVSCEFVGEQAVEVRYAEGVALALGRMASRLVESGALARGMTLGDLMNLPGAVQVGLGPGMEERSGALLLQALEGAMAAFVRTRREEGGRIAGQFGVALATLRACATRARTLQDQQVEAVRTALNQRIQQIGVTVEPGRLEQEVALAAEKADVAEEVVRLESHLKALGDLLAGEGRDLGKRLDHLLQEMQREISTLLAKSGLMELTQAGLEMRLVVEQLREQALNVA